MPILPNNPFELERLVSDILEDATYLTEGPNQRRARGLPATVEEMKKFILLHRKDYIDAAS
jgi:hypothetical protein